MKLGQTQKQTRHWKEHTKISKWTTFRNQRPKYREAIENWTFYEVLYGR